MPDSTYDLKGVLQDIRNAGLRQHAELFGLVFEKAAVTQQQLAERDAEIALLRNVLPPVDVEQAAEIEKLRQWQRDAVAMLKASRTSDYFEYFTQVDELISEVEGD